jgi:uncharacterized protein YdhG (YjbR/CyaY superfamily)
MAKTKFESVDAYIAAQPDATQAILGVVRRALRKALPRAEEVISYNMPAYKRRGGEVVLYFAAWKQHYSMYPASAALAAEFKSQLVSCRIEKNTLRFSLAEPVPVKLIERIAKFRAWEAADREIRKSRGANEGYRLRLAR